MDQLSTLPPELISSIFDYVRLSSETVMIGGISVALLPFTRKNLLHTVKITSQRSFKLFRRTIELGGREMAKLVRSISFTFYKVSDHAKTPVDIKFVKPFLISLSHSEELSICGGLGQTLVNCVLSEEFSKKYLRRMKKLDLTDAFSDAPDCYDPSLYSSLRHYKTLERLIVNQDNDQDDDPFINFVDPGPTTTLANIKHLEISGWLIFEHPVAHFISHFSKLKILKIDSAGPFSFPEALSRVSPSLRSLSVGAEEVYEPEDTIDAALLLLPPLSSLEVGYCSIMPDFYTNLNSIQPSLKNLTFSADSELTYEGIKQLLSGPHRLVSLRKLVLNFDVGTIGEQVPELSSRNLMREKGWRAPHWTEDFSYEDARELKRLSSAFQGVKISGSIGEAMKVQKRYTAEKLRVNRVRAKNGLELF